MDGWMNGWMDGWSVGYIFFEHTSAKWNVDPSYTRESHSARNNIEEIPLKNKLHKKKSNNPHRFYKRSLKINDTKQSHSDNPLQLYIRNPLKMNHIKKSNSLQFYE